MDTCAVIQQLLTYLFGKGASALVAGVQREVLGHPDFSGGRPTSVRLIVISPRVRRLSAGRGGAGAVALMLFAAARQRRADGALRVCLLSLLLAGDGGGQRGRGR